MKILVVLFYQILTLFTHSIYAMEPYTGRIVKDEGSYTAMQGIVHFIGWTIAIVILIWVFKFTKKHMKEDERYKQYLEKQKAEQQNKPTDTQ